jgi:hypothetical protein
MFVSPGHEPSVGISAYHLRVRHRMLGGATYEPGTSAAAITTTRIVLAFKLPSREN